MKYILASASPRRKELLEQIGLHFSIHKAVGEERITTDVPQDAVQELAMQKVKEVAAFYRDQKEPVLIIAADTVVAAQGRILGKPADEQDAARMLAMLQGASHEVYTGVALYYCGKDSWTDVFAEQTRVCVGSMTEEQIRAYIKTGEPMDKAGSYAIQGKFAVHIRRIEGDYANVVGLPLSALYEKLLQHGIDILSDLG